jgi:hypothetical protein
VKRPILGLLAAATLSFGVVGTVPAQAAAPPSSSSVPGPAHDDDRGGSRRHDHRYTRQHGHDRVDHDDDHDGDHHDGDHHRRRRRQCDGTIVVCLL